MGEIINITAYDCLAFDDKELSKAAMPVFMEKCENAIFWVNPVFASKQDDAHLAEYDYSIHQWRAGRFIGEASFSDGDKTYKITIKPRFGERALLKMLEQIFNVRITTSLTSSSESDWQHFIKKIIAIIWVQHLANANLHGVPKNTVKKKHQGLQVRGRIDVRKSILPIKTSNEIISYAYEKALDEDMLSIVNEAYHILKFDFDFGKTGINLPDSAQNALNSIFDAKIKRKIISYNQYKNIRYKEIYKSWKPLIDLSWDIIQQKAENLKQNKRHESIGFFLDMAEIWEQYLRSLLKKNLQPLGWHLKNQNLVAYPKYFFQRNLIPDLIFEKENQVMIWDAKYKRMIADYRDVDRADFFQIHTYILTQVNKKVTVGGLLYPLSIQENYSNEKFRSPYLLQDDGLKIKFAIDGIQLHKEIDDSQFNIRQTEFINRIKQDILE